MATITTNAISPAQPPKQAGTGGIDAADIEDWKQRFTDVLGKPAEHINNKSPETSRDWHNGLFECFTPIDTCKNLATLQMLALLTFNFRPSHLLLRLHYLRPHPPPPPQEWLPRGLPLAKHVLPLRLFQRHYSLPASHAVDHAAC